MRSNERWPAARRPRRTTWRAPGNQPAISRRKWESRVTAAQFLSNGELEYDQTRDIYNFHQSILDEAYRRRPGDDISGAITVALLSHCAEYVNANCLNNEMLDRYFENAVTMMEGFWSRRDGESPLDAILARMSVDLGNYFRLRGFWRLGQVWHERVIELLRSSSQAKNEQTLAYELYQQALLLHSSGNVERARTSLSECLGLNEKADNQQAVGTVLHALARIESSQGNPSEARRLLQRSLAIDESLGNQGGLSASLHQLAIIEADQGNSSEARNFWDRSIQICEVIGDVAGAASTRIILAQLEAMDGKFDKAIELARSAVEVFEQLGYPKAEQAREILRSIESLAAT